MFIGFYETDEKKCKLIKNFIKKIDPNINILDNNSCLEFNFDKDFISMNIDEELGRKKIKLSQKQKKDLLNKIFYDYWNTSFDGITEEICFFINCCIDEYLNNIK